MSKKAGTQRTKGAPVRFIDLEAQRGRLGSHIDDAIGRVLAHGRFILGPEVADLERRLAAFCGASHAVACSNGTDALVLALAARGVGAGDAVLVPSFTFCATAEAVVWTGATPLFVDVLPDSFNMDPASLEAGIATARREGLVPRAVMAVDLFGQPADYDAIDAVAGAHGLWVLADAAQSFGAAYRRRRVGTLGLISATSFYPAKPLGCYGDGGAVFTDDDAIAGALRSLHVHGAGADRYDNARIGLNARLDTMQAAILIEKLAIFADEIAARNAVAERYGEALSGVVAVPRLIEGATSVWAQYTIKVDPRARDHLAACLEADGIPTAIHYPRPLHLQTAYRGYPAAGSLPVSESLARCVLSLPMHPYLDVSTQARIVAALRKALGVS